MLMLNGWSLASALILMAFATPTSDPTPAAPDALGMHVGKVELRSVSQITFGPSNVLFLADPRAGQLYAIDLADTRKASLPGTYMVITELDQKIAAAMGTTPDKVRIGDMATHPATGALYLTVTRAGMNGSYSALVRVGSATSIEVVNLDQVRHSVTAVPSQPPSDTTEWYGQPKWAYSITDLKMVDGELWVAGLSNEQFVSSLRRVAFPFSKSNSLATVEIFHTVHNRWETASPITAFMPITLNGVSMVLAGYGCSPLALFPVADLKAGGHRKGRTVAELGSGSQPIDFVQYQREGKDYILIANNRRTLMRMDPADMAGAKELTTPVQRPAISSGVPYASISSTGVLAMSDMDAERIAVLVRDPDSGSIHLQAYSKKWL